MTIVIVAAVLVFIIIAFIYASVSYNDSDGLFARKPKIKYQCNDNIDNDADSLCDYDGCNIGRGKNKVHLSPDPDCTSSMDDSESCTSYPEVCDGLDNDCDNNIDEDLVKQCGVSNVGECQFGSSTCNSGTWSACTGNIDPVTEICDNKDNDCDGNIDEGCNCIDGMNKSCGSDIGECALGFQTCTNGDWGACIGEIGPVTEICDNKDNDCDGTTDEGCNCVNSQTRSCGSNIGECSSGTQTCSNGNWGACIGEIGPTIEYCDNKDNDCDNLIDEEGVCSTPDWCYDNDYGINPGIASNVSGYLNDTFYVYQDYCVANFTVKEYYCNNNYSSSIEVPCNSTMCYAGKCL